MASGVHQDRDCSQDHRTLDNTLESEQIDERTNIYSFRVFYLIFNLSDFGQQTQSSSVEKILKTFVYRDRHVAETRAACSRDPTKRFAEGQCVNASKGE